MNRRELLKLLFATPAAFLVAKYGVPRSCPVSITGTQHHDGVYELIHLVGLDGQLVHDPRWEITGAKRGELKYTGSKPFSGELTAWTADGEPLPCRVGPDGRVQVQAQGKKSVTVKTIEMKIV